MPPLNLQSEKKQPVSQSDTHHPLGGGKDISKWCSRPLWIFVASRMSQKKTYNNIIERMFFVRSYLLTHCSLHILWTSLFCGDVPNQMLFQRGCLRSPQTTGKLIPKKWKSISNWVLLSQLEHSAKNTLKQTIDWKNSKFRDIPIDVTGFCR